MQKIWTIILAAGASSRFGGIKALAEWNSHTLLHHAISLAPPSGNIVVIGGAHAGEIENALGDDVHYIVNENWEAGMGSSIASGLAYVEEQGGDIAIILPVDQPLVTTTHLMDLVNAAERKKQCILTKDGNVEGPPAAIPSSEFNGLKHIAGGGLKKTIHEYDVVEGQNMLFDVDTPQALQALKKSVQTGRS